MIGKSNNYAYGCVNYVTLNIKNSILFLLLVSSSPFFAQKIGLSVTFNDTLLRPTKIINYSKNIDLTSLKNELEEVIGQLHSQAYLIATIDSIVINNEQYNAFIQLGKRYKWTYLTTSGIDEEVLSKIGFRDKVFNQRPFNHKQLYSFYEKTIVHYENHGYPFASLKIDSIKINHTNIAANIRLAKNKLYKIDSVKITGTASISDHYIQNYIRIKDGDYYNEQLIKNISNRLKEIPFVEEKTPYKIVFTENESKIILNLKRKQASRFNGVLGIQPDNQTGDIRLTGDIKLNLLNAFKKGEEIDFNWRSIRKNTQDLKTGVMLPFLFNTPFGIDYDFKLFKKDTTFIDVYNKIGLRYSLKGNSYASVFFQNKSSSLLSTKGFESLTVLPNYADVTTQLYGMSLYFSNLDYRLNPRKGIEVDTEGSIGTKQLKKNPAINEGLYEGLKLNSNLYNFLLEANWYIPLKKRSVLKVGSKNGYTFNDNLFENELMRIGGLLTFRGFDEESINTSIYTIGTLEYRYLLEQNSYLYLFFDGAYYENQQVNSYVSDRPFGFGTGMSFETRAGIFSISYALGKQFDNPILFKNAKVHFGFVNYF